MEGLTATTLTEGFSRVAQDRPSMVMIDRRLPPLVESLQA